MPLNLLHLLWPSTIGENVCDWWCDTRVEFTLFLVSQKYIVLTMGTKFCKTLNIAKTKRKNGHNKINFED
jgi:hypothetical protein